MNEKLDNYLKDFIAYIYFLYTAVFIIVDILFASVFVTKNILCENLHPSSHICAIPCFIMPPPYLLHGDT